MPRQGCRARPRRRWKSLASPPSCFEWATALSLDVDLQAATTMAGGFVPANLRGGSWGSQVSVVSFAAGSTQLLGPSMTVRGVPADLTVGTQVYGVCVTLVPQAPISFLGGDRSKLSS